MAATSSLPAAPEGSTLAQLYVTGDAADARVDAGVVTLLTNSFLPPLDIVGVKPSERYWLSLSGAAGVERHKTWVVHAQFSAGDGGMFPEGIPIPAPPPTGSRFLVEWHPANASLKVYLVTEHGRTFVGMHITTSTHFWLSDRGAPVALYPHVTVASGWGSLRIDLA